MSEQEEIARARALFESFHKRPPRNGEIVAIPSPKGATVVLEVGTLLSLGYRSSGDGEAYYHEFESKRPKVFVTSDGRQAFLIGGSYTFTERGFIK